MKEVFLINCIGHSVEENLLNYNSTLIAGTVRGMGSLIIATHHTKKDDGETINNYWVDNFFIKLRQV